MAKHVLKAGVTDYDKGVLATVRATRRGLLFPFLDLVRGIWRRSTRFFSRKCLKEHGAVSCATVKHNSSYCVACMGMWLLVIFETCRSSIRKALLACCHVGLCCSDHCGDSRAPLLSISGLPKHCVD